MFSRKHIVVGVATGAAVAIVLGLSVGHKQASVNRSSVASYSYGETGETMTGTKDHHDAGEHHTMEECAKIGYYYVQSSGKSGKGGKGGYRKERTLQKKTGLRKISEYYGGSKGSKGSYGGYQVHEGGHHMSMELLNLNHFETEYEGKSGKGSESGYGYGSKGSKGSYGGYEHEGGSYFDHAGGDHSGLIEYCTLECENYHLHTHSYEVGYEVSSGKSGKGSYSSGVNYVGYTTGNQDVEYSGHYEGGHVRHLNGHWAQAEETVNHSGDGTEHGGHSIIVEVSSEYGSKGSKGGDYSGSYGGDYSGKSGKGSSYGYGSSYGSYEIVCRETEEKPQPAPEPEPAPEPPAPEPIPPEPIVSPVSAAPTPCGGRPFFSQTHQFSGGVVSIKCTNDGFGDGTVYDTIQECCTANFANVEECKIVDICNPTPEPTENPTPAPVTYEPTDAPAPKPIPPVPIIVVTPEPTVNPTPAPVTSEPTKDPTLSPVTSAPTPCESRIIFIVTVNEETICSNGNYESVDSENFFDNFDDCCDMLVADGKVDAVDKCKREDICNPTEAPTPAPVSPEPTKNPTPAPIETIETPSPVTAEPTPEPATPAPTPCEGRNFYSEEKDGVFGCTNEVADFTVNDFTGDIFDTSKECCDALVNSGDLGANEKCRVVDICNPTEAPTPAPVSPEPTKNPTPAPVSPEPTENPTPAPVSPEPTENPTPAPVETIVTAEPTPEPATPAPTPCEGRKFYSEEKDGVFGCTNEVADFTVNDFTGDIFDTSKECCDALVNSGDLGANEKCRVVDICNPSEAPTVSPTNVVTTGSTPTVGTESESGLTMPPR